MVKKYTYEVYDLTSASNAYWYLQNIKDEVKFFIDEVSHGATDTKDIKLWLLNDDKLKFHHIVDPREKAEKSDYTQLKEYLDNEYGKDVYKVVPFGVTEDGEFFELSEKGNYLDSPIFVGYVAVLNKKINNEFYTADNVERLMNNLSVIWSSNSFLAYYVAEEDTHRTIDVILAKSYHTGNFIEEYFKAKYKGIKDLGVTCF